MQLGRTEQSSSDESGGRSGAARTDFGRQARQRAREEARRQQEIAKEEIGNWAFDTLESYFPEQAKSRRRQDTAMIFVVGIAVGILLRHVAGR